MDAPGTDEELATLLAGTTRFQHLVHVAACASTQDLAAALAPAYGPTAPDRDAVFWADHQTRGRGRQQREWNDEPGQDLAVTFRVCERLPNPLALPAAAPLAVLRAIEPLLGRRLELKWPNDVLAAGQKLAGVLIDAGGGGVDRYAIGIGVNVNRVRFPRDLEPRATSMALVAGRSFERRALLLRLAQCLDEAIAALARGDETTLADQFADRIGLVGRRVEGEAGAPFAGVLRRIDFERLLLEGGTSLPLGQVTALRAAR